MITYAEFLDRMVRLNRMARTEQVRLVTDRIWLDFSERNVLSLLANWR